MHNYTQTLERNTYCSNAKPLKVSVVLPCKFISAVLIFVILNLVFLFADRKYALSAKMQNAVHFDFPGIEKLCQQNNIKSQHEILLLGSSLLIYPIWKLDRKFGAKCSDPNHYHGAYYLCKKFSAGRDPAVVIRNLGVGGAMVSDYYLLFQKYLSSADNNPDWVIVDCAPRSFFDGGLSAANETSIFDFFYNTFDVLSLGKKYLPSLNSCFELCAEQSCYIYKNRRWVKETILNCLKSQIFETKPQRESKISSTTNVSITQSKMQSSLEEYKGRYFAISEKTIQPQLMFLELLVNSCLEKKIRLLFINMPLTELNRSLLDPSFYHNYTSSLKATVLRRGDDVYFLDLSNNNIFKLADFDDTVHLNEQGAIKLQDEIVDFINNAIPRANR